MHIRALIATLLSLALVPLGLAPAAAEPEPDNYIWQASGPIMDGNIQGSLASSNDQDWFMFYVASQTQLRISLQPRKSCGIFSDADLTLRDATGGAIRSAEFPSSAPYDITYTTPVGVTQYFIQVAGDCLGSYRATISPSTALVWGSSMPQATVPTGEPNESLTQAQGPIFADTIYTGSLQTSNDVDWFAFWANAAFLVQATSGNNCGGEIALYDADGDSLAYRSYGTNYYSQMTYTPTDWSTFYLKVTSRCTGSAYRFTLWPGTSIQASPKPAPAPAPAPVAPAPVAPAPVPVAGSIAWTKYRKTRKRVVIYWPAASNATSYRVTYRVGRRSAKTIQTVNAWLSLPRKAGKRGVNFSVTALAAGGPGPVSTWRFKY